MVLRFSICRIATLEKDSKGEWYTLQMKHFLERSESRIFQKITSHNCLNAVVFVAVVFMWRGANPRYPLVVPLSYEPGYNLQL